jgi:hypothetical protein
MDSGELLPTIPANPPFNNKLTRLYPWIASLWLLLMTGWYVAVAVRGLTGPHRRADLAWGCLLAVFVVVVVLSHLLDRRRLVTLIWLGLMTVAAILMIALSHQVVAALITAWLLVLAWTWGDWTLRQLGVEPNPPPLYRTSVALPLGLALMALIALGLGVSHRLTSRWVWLVFSALALVQCRGLVRLGLRCRRLLVLPRRFEGSGPTAEAGIIVVLLGCLFLLDLSWALAPDINFDALSAHLPVARHYSEHSVTSLTYGTAANLVDLLFAIAMSLHGQIVAKLMVLASSVLTTIGVYAFGRALFSARVGLWAAALFFSTPLVSWLSATAYVDAVVTMFLLATLIAFFRWRDDRKTGWLWASGLLMGGAIAAKLNALLGLPVIGLMLLWELVRGSQPLGHRLKGLAGYLLGIALVAAPGMIVCYALIGDPLPLPVLDKVLKGSSASLISNSFLFGIGTSPEALLNLPFAFTFETQKFGEGLPSGAIGLALLLAPLALSSLFAGRAEARRTAILFAVCVVYIGCLAYIVQYGRYYIPLLPVVTVLAAATLKPAFKEWLHRANMVLLGIVVATQVTMTPLVYAYMADRFPVKVDLGLESRESFLTRSLGVYPVTRFLNERMEPGRKVLSVGAPTVRFYLNAQMMTPFDPEVLQAVANSTPNTLASHFMQEGFSYLFVAKGAWENAGPLIYASEPFLSHYTTLEYATNEVKVYRLHAAAVEPRTRTNLLANPGFELIDESSYPAGWMPYGQPRISQTSEEAHAGKVAIRADSDDGLLTTATVESRQIYTLGHWTRADSPGQIACLQINWLDKTSRLLGVSNDIVSAGPAWGWNQLTAPAPEGAVMAIICLSVWENSEVWFDDFSFVRE